MVAAGEQQLRQPMELPPYFDQAPCRTLRQQPAHTDRQHQKPPLRKSIALGGSQVLTYRYVWWGVHTVLSLEVGMEREDDWSTAACALAS